MLKSMTGFGSSEHSSADTRIVCQIKSVNHKFIDINIRPKDIDINVEKNIREIVSKNSVRGSIDISFKLIGLTDYEYSINKKAVKKLERELIDCNLINKKASLTDIKDVPGIIITKTSQSSKNKKILKTFREAYKVFIQDRANEGKKILRVFDKKIRELIKKNNLIKKNRSKINNERHVILRNKALELLDKVDESRLEQEVALLSLKLDVDEEVERIEFHSESLKAALKKNNPNGKEIDFILQEMFREANTLSVKLDSPSIKSIALDIKLLVESMREQAQNIE